jgi:hypothetical protein
VTILVARHTTERQNVASIMRLGLLPRRTADFNYPDYTHQPQGVYVIPEDGPDTRFWRGDDTLEDHVVLEVAYTGPIQNDDEVYYGLVLLEHVPPEHVRVLETTPAPPPKVFF